MNCTDVLKRFTDYLDGGMPVEELEAIEEHLSVCPSCGRYRTVVERGATLVRGLPEPELREDFEPRLRHRIYHVDDERILGAHQSATPAMTVLGIAILLTALAWAPLLTGAGRDVMLEPIVVDRAPRDASRFLPVLLTPPGTFSTTTPSETPSDLDDGLWENTLLYEYSALYQRYGQRGRLRRVADVDR